LIAKGYAQIVLDVLVDVLEEVYIVEENEKVVPIVKTISLRIYPQYGNILMISNSHPHIVLGRTDYWSIISNKIY
jgi:hypothetical protein